MTYITENISLDVHAIRTGLGLNQREFWGRLGVSQSGGSRYETGRPIPYATYELLRILYIEQLDIEGVSQEDIAIIRYLQKRDTDLYESLKKAVKSPKPRQKVA